MKTTLILGGLLCLVTSTSVGAAGADMRIAVNAFLCNSATQAVQFADIVATGEIEEIAKDRVGHLAQAEVCGRYVGVATILSERVTLQGGAAYRLTAYRFEEGHRVAWLAERSFAPVATTDWNL